MIKALKIQNELARTVENYSSVEKKKMYELLNYWQKMILANQIKCNQLKFDLDFDFFKELTKTKTTAFEKIKVITNGIGSKRFNIALPDRDELISFSPIPTMIFDIKNEVVHVELNEKCVDYFNPKMNGGFYFADLLMIEKVKSRQAIKLYELMSEFRLNKILKLKFDKIRELFELEDSYRSSDIKIKIIDKSLKILESKMGIIITNVKYTKKKKKYDMVEIKFNLPKLLEEDKKDNSIKFIKNEKIINVKKKMKDRKDKYEEIY